MKKLILTGASGYIGRTVLAHLRRTEEFEIHCIVRNNYVRGDDIQTHPCDLTSPEDTFSLLRKIKADTLIHLAWDVTPGRYLSMPSNNVWLTASKNLIDAFYENGNRFVGVGTCLEYADNKGDKCKEGLTPLNPMSPYPECKNLLNIHLKKKAAEKDLSHAWIRIFYSFGIYEHPLRFVPILINSLLKNERYGPKNGALIRDYIFSGDLGNQILEITKSRIEGDINTGSGKGTRLTDLANKIGEMMGKRELVDNSGSQGYGNESRSIVADMSRYEGAVRPLLLRSLERSLEETINWHTYLAKKA